MRKKQRMSNWKKGSLLLGICLLTACGKENAEPVDGQLTPTEAALATPTGGEAEVSEAPTTAPEPTEEAAAPTTGESETAGADGLTEVEVIRLVEEESGETAVWYSYGDYNKDGLAEGFVLTGEAGAGYWGDEEPKEDGTYESYYGRVWFVSEAGVTQLLGENYYALPECMELAGEQFVNFETLHASDSLSHLYQVTAEGAHDILPGAVMGITQLEDGRIEGWQSAYDICGDGTGHSWKPYYFYYENGLKEYGGIVVEETVFRQYAGADAILDAVYAAGGRLGEILYFSYGSFYINYQVSSEFDEAVMVNAYLEARLDEEQPFTVNVVSCFEGAETMLWNDIINLEVCYLDGVYLSALLPEIAVYPEMCEVPEEYYTEQYADMEKSALVLKLSDGKTVLTGEDITAISATNMIFTLSDEFLEAAKARIENGAEEQTVYGVQRLLGMTENESGLELWLGDELLVETTACDYLAYDAAGFMTGQLNKDSEPDAYRNRLVLMNYGLSGLVEVKLHAFARATGLLVAADPVEIDWLGACATEQEYQIDLDGDGELDSLYYGQKEFLINGKNYYGMLLSQFFDNLDTGNFFLVDLDVSDGITEIAIWSHGPSADECCALFWYDGSTLLEMGTLSGPQNTSMAEWAMDGAGRITLPCRLSLLQTWWADKTFELNQEGHVLELVQQEQYLVTGEMADREYELYRSIRLYEEMDADGDYTILEPQLIKLPATDDDCFVWVQAEDGSTGYLYVEDGKVQLADGSYEDWENPAIEGLNYAD